MCLSPACLESMTYGFCLQHSVHLGTYSMTCIILLNPLSCPMREMLLFNPFHQQRKPLDHPQQHINIVISSILKKKIPLTSLPSPASVAFLSSKFHERSVSMWYLHLLSSHSPLELESVFPCFFPHSTKIPLIKITSSHGGESVNTLNLLILRTRLAKHTRLSWHNWSLPLPQNTFSTLLPGPSSCLVFLFGHSPLIIPSLNIGNSILWPLLSMSWFPGQAHKSSWF